MECINFYKGWIVVFVMTIEKVANGGSLIFAKVGIDFMTNEPYYAAMAPLQKGNDWTSLERLGQEKIVHYKKYRLNSSFGCKEVQY